MIIIIYITGDCHGEWGNKLSAKAFPEQKEMSRDDFVLVCGDFGLWNDDNTERYWLDWLEDKNFTLCFVDGNHENFDRLYGDEFEVVDFHGGKAHRIRENVFHLMRGYVFELCGKKIFAFGGASSHDIQDGILDRDDFVDDAEFEHTKRQWNKSNKMYRINHVSWCKEELPSQEEMDLGLQTLEKHDNKVDFIVSHCCPQNVVTTFSGGMYQPDILTEYFDSVAEKVEFKKWFFGHYHNDTQVLCDYIMLYDQIIRIA